MKRLSLEDVEYFAHNLAAELMDYGEPIPPFSTRSPGKLESCLEQPFVTFDGQDLYPSLLQRQLRYFTSLLKIMLLRTGTSVWRLRQHSSSYLLTKNG